MGSTPIARSKPRKHCRRCTGFVSQAGPFNSGTRLQSVYLNRKRTSLVGMRTRFEAGRRLHALQALLVMHRPCKSDKSVRFGREAPPGLAQRECPRPMSVRWLFDSTGRDQV